MEDIESFMSSPMEPTQWGGGTRRVTVKVYGKIVKWHKSSGQWVIGGTPLCQIEVITHGIKPGEEVEFARSPRDADGTLIIEHKFETVPSYVMPGDTIATIETDYALI